MTVLFSRTFSLGVLLHLAFSPPALGYEVKVQKGGNPEQTETERLTAELRERRKKVEDEKKDKKLQAERDEAERKERDIQREYQREGSLAWFRHHGLTAGGRVEQDISKKDGVKAATGVLSYEGHEFKIKRGSPDSSFSLIYDVDYRVGAVLGARSDGKVVAGSSSEGRMVVGTTTANLYRSCGIYGMVGGSVEANVVSNPIGKTVPEGQISKAKVASTATAATRRLR
jgi:hypothetical protein